jgi:hypothetical protein
LTSVVLLFELITNGADDLLFLLTVRPHCALNRRGVLLITRRSVYARLYPPWPRAIDAYALGLESGPNARLHRF